jgi:uncharacterized protein (DUF697 family)
MSIKKKRSRLYQSAESDSESGTEDTSAVKPQVNLNNYDSNYRRNEADAIVKRYAYYGSGVGLLPVPFAEVVTVNAVQYAMIKKLAACYDLPFKDQWVKSLVSSLLSGVVSASIIYGPITNALTLMTGFGWFMRAGVSLSVSGAVTIALGKLFIDHFERGGSFSDLDIEQSKAQLKGELAIGA